MPQMAVLLLWCMVSDSTKRPVVTPTDPKPPAHNPGTPSASYLETFLNCMRTDLGLSLELFLGIIYFF